MGKTRERIHNHEGRGRGKETPRERARTHQLAHTSHADFTPRSRRTLPRAPHAIWARPRRASGRFADAGAQLSVCPPYPPRAFCVSFAQRLARLGRCNIRQATQVMALEALAMHKAAHFVAVRAIERAIEGPFAPSGTMPPGRVGKGPSPREVG